MQEFWLKPASKAQRNISPEHIWSACPCVGVFKSEDAFKEYLRTYHVPRYGAVKYMGIRNNPPFEIHPEPKKPPYWYKQSETVRDFIKRLLTNVPNLDVPICLDGDLIPNKISIEKIELNDDDENLFPAVVLKKY